MKLTTLLYDAKNKIIQIILFMNIWLYSPIILAVCI